MRGGAMGGARSGFGPRGMSGGFRPGFGGGFRPGYRGGFWGRPGFGFRWPWFGGWGFPFFGGGWGMGGGFFPIIGMIGAVLVLCAVLSFCFVIAASGFRFGF